MKIVFVSGVILGKLLKEIVLQKHRENELLLCTDAYNFIFVLTLTLRELYIFDDVKTNHLPDLFVAYFGIPFVLF